MKRPFAFRPLLLFVLCLALALGSRQPAAAQSGSGASTVLSTGYDLTWYTLGGGGDTSTGSGFIFAGTIGQSDAGTAMNSNGFTLAGGFWIGVASQYHVYLPLVIK
jgi:hypothetical protein